MQATANFRRMAIPHPGSVLDMAASPDGTMVAIAFSDGNVLVW